MLSGGQQIAPMPGLLFLFLLPSMHSPKCQFLIQSAEWDQDCESPTSSSIVFATEEIAVYAHQMTRFKSLKTLPFMYNMLYQGSCWRQVNPTGNWAHFFHVWCILSVAAGMGMHDRPVGSNSLCRQVYFPKHEVSWKTWPTAGWIIVLVNM